MTPKFHLFFWAMANEISFSFCFGKDTRLIPFLAAKSKAVFKNYDYLLAWGAISTLIQKSELEPELSKEGYVSQLDEMLFISGTLCTAPW